MFTEDSQGVSFFKILIQKLKSINLIDNSLKIHIDTIPGNSPCYSKQTRIFSALSNFDKIIIVFDSDGLENRQDKMQKMKNHIPDEFESKFRLILCDYEIEEWICKSLSLNFSNQKPSSRLNEYCLGKSYGSHEFALFRSISSSIYQKQPIYVSIRTY